VLLLQSQNPAFHLKRQLVGIAQRASAQVV
jgi:hypothetical protein